jgi:hypothetical protein
MEAGTFLGIYDSRIQDFENRIQCEKEHLAARQIQREMYIYMTDCVPYLMEYTRASDDVNTEGPFDIKIKKGIQRKEIYYDYLRQVENFKGSFEHEVYKTISIYANCSKCVSTNIFVDSKKSVLVCMDCGLCTEHLGDELSYKEEQETSTKMITNSYKRDNHLNEWIMQFQGRETTNIPPQLLDQLRSEFKKQKIQNIKDITQSKVKANLKKLRMSKYYEHATYITNILNGVDPPTMTPALEERLRMMFREIQAPFEKHCPANRSNFLSYSYVLYKFCELLGEDDYLPYFPLLKSKEKLRHQDVIWKGICGELLWEYILTV